MTGSWKNSRGVDKAWINQDGVITIEAIQTLTAEEASSLADWLTVAVGESEVTDVQA